MCVVGGCWVVRLANDRAAEVLGTADADALIGRGFWEIVSLRDGGVAPEEAFRQQLLEGTDFTAQVKAYTDSGRKVWLSCAFTSGTLAQLDDQCPVVSVPMDLCSEPGTKAAYWFATVQPLAESSPAATAFSSFKRGLACDAPEPAPETSLVNTEFASYFERNSLEVCPQPHPGALNGIKRCCGDWRVMYGSGWCAADAAARAIQDMPTSSKISQTLQSQLLHVLHVPAGGGAGLAAGAEGALGEHALAEMLPSEDAGRALAALEAVQARWGALGLPERAVLDILRVQAGDGMLLVLRRLPMPICMSLRTAMHEGVWCLHCAQPGRTAAAGSTCTNCVMVLPCAHSTCRCVLGSWCSCCRYAGYISGLRLRALLTDRQ